MRKGKWKILFFLCSSKRKFNLIKIFQNFTVCLLHQLDYNLSCICLSYNSCLLVKLWKRLCLWTAITTFQVKKRKGKFTIQLICQCLSLNLIYWTINLFAGATFDFQTFLEKLFLSLLTSILATLQNGNHYCTQLRPSCWTWWQSIQLATLLVYRFFNSFNLTFSRMNFSQLFYTLLYYL